MQGRRNPSDKGIREIQKMSVLVYVKYVTHYRLQIWFAEVFEVWARKSLPLKKFITYFLTLWRRNYFLILALPVYKM